MSARIEGWRVLIGPHMTGMNVGDIRATMQEQHGHDGATGNCRECQRAEGGEEGADTQKENTDCNRARRSPAEGELAHGESLNSRNERRGSGVPLVVCATPPG